MGAEGVVMTVGKTALPVGKTKSLQSTDWSPTLPSETNNKIIIDD